MSVYGFGAEQYQQPTVEQARAFGAATERVVACSERLGSIPVASQSIAQLHPETISYLEAGFGPAAPTDIVVFCLKGVWRKYAPSHMFELHVERSVTTPIREERITNTSIYKAGKPTDLNPSGLTWDVRLSRKSDMERPLRAVPRQRAGVILPGSDRAREVEALEQHLIPSRAEMLHVIDFAMQLTTDYAP